MNGPRILYCSRTRALVSAGIVFGCLSLTAGKAFAQDADASDVYILRSNHEYSDGQATVSTSQDIVVGRARRGDRTMILQDFQGGAVAVESGGRTVAASTISPRRIDAASAYDYSDVRASGDGGEVALFNTRLRPLIAQFPAPGAEGRWTAQTSLGALGISAPGAESVVRIELRRARLSHQGQDLVVIEFEIPAFAYRLPGGEAVTHWARGMAVTDQSFAVIHVAATQHRATAIAVDGTVRPFAVRTSLHAIERDGRMRLRLGAVPEVAAAVRRLAETRGEPIMALSRAGAAEPFPSEVAARLDLASFAIGEGGANPLPAVTGPARATPTGLPAGAQDATAAFRQEAAEVLRSQGMSDQEAQRLLNVLVDPDRSRPLYDRMEDLDAFRRQILRMNPGWDAWQRADADLTPSERALRQVMRVYLDQENLQIIEARLTEARRREEARWVEAGGSPDDPEFQALQREARERAEKILSDRYTRILQRARIIEGPAEEPDLANELVPGWINDPTNPNAAEDEALYRSLLAEMSLEIEEAQEIMRRLREDRERRREETVYDDTDDFFLNNAFTYSSMVGIVATDLSRWGDWLATQNVRELERLALQIGYPNLASALNDAQNLMRYAGDEGYRRWATQAPSCGGLTGCGPSYLERWAMRQATVRLGDILSQSRDIFSSGGFTDIGISGLNLSYLLRDNALQDGDIVQIRLTQFGRTLFQGQVNLTNLGERFSQVLRRGVASLEIFAVNEGFASPNTAQIVIDDVVRGNATQSYSLETGQTATLRIESNVPRP